MEITDERRERNQEKSQQRMAQVIKQITPVFKPKLNN